jgi:RNA polymerase sigma factor (TIGR02999 family)
MNEITQVLERIEKGEASAAEALLPLVYEELRKLAAQKMAQENPGQTLQPTALVHEAYLRLVDVEERQRWDGRGHFFAAAAEAMRRILVERARRKKAVKHGGGRQRLDTDTVAIVAPENDDDLVAIDEALDRLAALDPVKAELVKLRYFAGLTIEECAEALRISCATAKRYWAYSRVWLFEQVSGEATSQRNTNPQ